MHSFSYRYRYHSSIYRTSYEGMSRAQALVQLPLPHTHSHPPYYRTKRPVSLIPWFDAQRLTHAHAHPARTDQGRIRPLTQLAPHLPPPLTHTHPALYFHARRLAVPICRVNRHSHICTYHTDVPRDHTPNAGPLSGGAPPPTQPVVPPLPLAHLPHRCPTRPTAAAAGHEWLRTQSRLAASEETSRAYALFELSLLGQCPLAPVAYMHSLRYTPTYTLVLSLPKPPRSPLRLSACCSAHYEGIIPQLL